MHFSNGRLAQEGDPVVGSEYGKFYAGTIHSLSSTSDTCNCQVAIAKVGGVVDKYANIKDLMHAEDLWHRTSLKSVEQEREERLHPPATGDGVGG